MTSFRGPSAGLRPALYTDREIVAGWFTAPEEVYLFAGDSASWPLTGDALAEHDARSGGQSFVLGADGTVAAHLTLRGLDTAHVHLTRIAVAPSLRGRGLAAPLVASGVARAEGAGATWLTMFVVPGNEPALRAYARAGFVEAGVDPEHPEYVLMTRGTRPPAA